MLETENTIWKTRTQMGDKCFAKTILYAFPSPWCVLCIQPLVPFIFLITLIMFRNTHVWKRLHTTHLYIMIFLLPLPSSQVECILQDFLPEHPQCALSSQRKRLSHIDINLLSPWETVSHRHKPSLSVKDYLTSTQTFSQRKILSHIDTNLLSA